MLVLFAACHSKKKLVSEKPRDFVGIESRDTLIKLPGDPINRKNWEYFSGRIAMDYSDPEAEDLSGTISLRMKKDSIIWFSVSVAMGIQVAKGIITADSVHILDVFHKEYTAYATTELNKLAGAEIGLRNLQNLIIGNPVFDTLFYQNDSASKGWYAVSHPAVNMVFLNNSNGIDSSFIAQKGTTNQLKSVYEGTKTAGTFDVAEWIMLTAFGDKKTVRCKMQFITASDAVIPSYPFNIPSGYKRKE
jgi:hypothetical protein